MRRLFSAWKLGHSCPHLAFEISQTALMHTSLFFLGGMKRAVAVKCRNAQANKFNCEVSSIAFAQSVARVCYISAVRSAFLESIQFGHDLHSKNVDGAWPAWRSAVGLACVASCVHMVLCNWIRFLGIGGRLQGIQ